MRVYKRNHEDILRACCWLHSIHLHQHKGFACKFKKIHCLQTMSLNMLQPLNRMIDMPAQSNYFGMSWSWTIQINANQHTCSQIVLLQALVVFPNSAAWALKLLNFSPLRASMVKLQQFAGPWMFYVSSMPQCDATVSCLTLQRITLHTL